LLDELHIANRIACGSALKFCRIAEGAADIYPRLAPTCEWDVAAGHALVAAAGGTVTLPQGGTLRYGETASDFRVPAFIAWGDRTGILEAVAAVHN
jgi:3'(2'), 5'-bisphosphate nucleotidase